MIRAPWCSVRGEPVRVRVRGAVRGRGGGRRRTRRGHRRPAAAAALRARPHQPAHHRAAALREYTTHTPLHIAYTP
jgi:hypothetical protein